MSDQKLWLALVLGGLGTFVLRFSFIALQGRLQPGPFARRVLRFVPVAALTALIVPATFLDPQGIHPDALIRGIAALAAGLVAWRFKSTLLTILVGLGVLWGLLALRAWLT